MNSPLEEEIPLSLWRAALERVSGARAVADWLERRRPVWSRVMLLAVGKAALAMAGGAVAVLGERVVGGLVITKAGHGVLPTGSPLTLREAGHPVPDAGSLAAGADLRQRLALLPRNVHPLLLLSGGSSSLMECLPDGVSLDHLARVNRWLLGSGLDIHAMNRVRKGLSLVKGGRLAGLLHGREATVLILSDVRGDDPAVIGSGPLTPDPGGPLPALPDWILDLLARAPPPPPPDHPAFAALSIHLVATLGDALEAARRRALDWGLPVRVMPDFLDGEAAVRGRELGRAVAAGPPGVTLWGGET
ncbi:MAG: DUF4147 domain-containing protein, partial [Magnetococcales bacterium]|nr:DUF4147 domain-containing protein [Magnetococcales bacterium]